MYVCIWRRFCSEAPLCDTLLQEWQCMLGMHVGGVLVLPSSKKDERHNVE